MFLDYHETFQCATVGRKIETLLLTCLPAVLGVFFLSAAACMAFAFATAFASLSKWRGALVPAFDQRGRPSSVLLGFSDMMS